MGKSESLMSGFQKLFRVVICRAGWLFRIAFLMVGVMAPGIGLAEMRLKMGDDVVFVIANGDFDAETYNGWFSDVKIFKRDRLEAKMDRIDVRSRKLVDSGMIHIDRLEVENYAEPRRARIAALVIENLRLKGPGKISIDSWQDAVSMMGEGFSLRVADMVAEDDEFTMTLGLLELAPLSWSSLPSGQRFLGAGAVGFSDLKITPKAGLESAFRDEEFRALMGGEHLLVSGDFAQNAVFDAGRLTVAVSGRVDLAALGGVAYDAEIHTSEGAAEAILRAAETPDTEMDKQTRASVLSDTEIIAASVEVRDDGLRPRLIQRAADERAMSIDAALETATQQVSQSLTALFPSEGARLSAGVERFLTKGGALRVAMRPAVSIPLSNLPAFLMLPDAAVRQLNITAAHVD